MKSSFINMVLSLTGITLVAGAALGFVNYLTEKPIAEAQEKARLDAIADILPTFDSVTEHSCGDMNLYVTECGDNMSGIAVETYSDAGFGGQIVLMAGFDCNGSLTGYRVLSHAETPGLGDKMGDWFRNEQVLGSTAPIAVKADGGEIDAITGATITSRAFTEAINKARQAYKQYKDESK